MIIGVCGEIGTGKSRFCDIATISSTGTRHAKHINLDNLFKEKVLRNIAFRVSAVEFFKLNGIEYFKNGVINSVELMDYLFGDTAKEDNYSLLKGYNTICAPYILEYLQDEIDSYSGTIFVESATLTSSSFSDAFSPIILVKRKSDFGNVKERSQSRHLTSEMYENIRTYQSAVLEHNMYKVDMVFENDYAVTTYDNRDLDNKIRKFVAPFFTKD